MGRWAQRRMRGGGPAVAGPPSPPTLTVTGVSTSGGSEGVVTFSAPIALDTGVGPDGSFTFNGNVPSSVSLDSATQARVFGVGPFGLGDPWAVTAQPNWLVTALVVPESGNA